MGKPDSCAEAFALLARHDVISAQLADDLGAMCGLRDRIAHGYASVDFERIWRELPAGISALDGFMGAIARLVA